MRIVPNLDEVRGCPNCQNNVLVVRTNDFGRPYLFCRDCHEEIFENETTCSEGQCAVYHIEKIADLKEELLKQKQREKENFILETREKIDHLTWSIHDARSMALVREIQNIFNKIIDYIEEN